MSMKPVEMQFALHKNDEAGLKQHQMVQKRVEDQAMLNSSNEKSTIKERQVSAKTEEASQASIKDDQSGRSGEREPRGNGGAKKSAEEAKQAPGDTAPEHPFKGHHIDLTL
ncbi:hypothetical protein AV654_31475 [Paenibacillus elgii]|uniref:RNA polymerase subunit sigma n=2 Tax=Paenibacillus elgii TaxID=189691 RepID=A0A163UTV5_9BACL|nr:hypothetical protein [Paenibacillus elgii]KZE73846.1 hypothetical protein AV654_31475 [Paenibacillus elgii]NEN85150.1 hypothetical protein [Paenibacillus elgii]PUA36269.1 hypothetical protein C8Z91_26135 [Paenibacillus elgii]